MSVTRDQSTVSVEPRGGLARLSRAVHPLGPVMPGVIRRALGAVPVAADPHPGKRPMSPVALHREERCLATLVDDRLGISCF
jgi:hypothetical protein